MATAESARRDLTEALGAAILGGVHTDSDGQDHLAIVLRTAEAEREVRLLLHQSVAAARAAGHSWAELGAELGMSRQAAQQRFGSDDPSGAGAGDASGAGDGEAEERWLGPVTALDEMKELALAGRLGWRTVGAGMMKHRVRRTATQWEHRRVMWSGSSARHERDGWEVAFLAFPWVYLVRDTGRPAEGGPGETSR